MSLDKRLTIIFVLLALGSIACHNLGKDKGKLAQWQARGYISVAKIGGDFKTIQEAIDFAPNGWTIKVHGGTYCEEIVVHKEGLTIEAFDPINEPVIIDGADQTLKEKPLEWEKLTNEIYVADYTWPYQLVSEYEYSSLGASDEIEGLMSVYADGLLLRGYREPFVTESIKGKSLLPFPSNRLGLAGPYQSLEEFKKLAPLAANGPGNFFYDEANKKLYLWLKPTSEPAKVDLEIPRQKNLVWLKADAISLNNLIFKNALSYALVIEKAWDCSVKGCVFANCHFAILLKEKSSCNIIGNCFIDLGFSQGYRLQDIEGTLYERSTICCLEQDVGQVEEKSKEVEKNCELVLAENIFYGVALSFNSSALPLKFKDNLVIYPILNLFSRQALDYYEGKAEITGNVFSHLSTLLAFPKAYAEGSSIDFSYNCLYLEAELLPQDLKPSEARLPVVFSHNTLALAGNTLGRPIPYEREAGFDSSYNLFYGSDFNYTIYLDRGMGNLMPVVACPYLSDNIYLTPPKSGLSYQTLSINNRTYVYQQEGPSGQRPSIFARETAFEDKGFYLTCFGLNRKKIDPRESGLDCQGFCKERLKEIKAFFAQAPDSPALNKACPLGESGAYTESYFGALWN